MPAPEKSARESLGERLFSAPFIDFAGGVVAIISGLASILAYVYTAIDHPSDETAALVSIGVLSLILCTAIAILAMAYAQKVNKMRRQATALQSAELAVKQAQGDHVVSAQWLNTIFGEFVASLDDSHHTRTPHLGLLVNSVRTIFERLSSSAQSAVCIKLLKSNHGGSEVPFVWTAKRDDLSIQMRGKIDERPDLKRYTPDANKAFSDIMSRSVGRDYFFSNDLKRMGDYFNSNPHWHEFYNAAVVVPIKPCRADVQQSAIGFLCVDSLHGTFNEDVSVATLTLIAEILYRHLKTLSATVLEPPE